MTIAELINKLQEYPDKDMQVLLPEYLGTELLPITLKVWDVGRDSEGMYWSKIDDSDTVTSVLVVVADLG